jgi:hypothetical protein
LPDPSDLEVDPDIAAIDTSGHEDLADADAAADEPKVAPVANPKEEDDARQYGWVDKAAWVASGKPEKQWRSATEFNEFRAQATPILAKENKQLRERLERLERDQEVRAQVEADARRNIQKESLTLKLRQAREENDWDAADKIAEELLDIRIEEKARPKPEQAANPKAAEEFQSFLGSNTIYKTDESLQEALAVEVRSLIQVRGTNDPAGVLAKANERVRRMYPEKFAKPNHSMADGDGGGGGGDSAPTLGWGDLKPDVRRQYENMLGGGVTKEGLLKRLRQYPNVYFGRR